METLLASLIAVCVGGLILRWFVRSLDRLFTKEVPTQLGVLSDKLREDRMARAISQDAIVDTLSRKADELIEQVRDGDEAQIIELHRIGNLLRNGQVEVEPPAKRPPPPASDDGSLGGYMPPCD